MYRSITTRALYGRIGSQVGVNERGYAGEQEVERTRKVDNKDMICGKNQLTEGKAKMDL